MVIVSPWILRLGMSFHARLKLDIACFSRRARVRDKGAVWHLPTTFVNSYQLESETKLEAVRLGEVFKLAERKELR